MARLYKRLVYSLIVRLTLINRQVHLRSFTMPRCLLLFLAPLDENYITSK